MGRRGWLTMRLQVVSGALCKTKDEIYVKKFVGVGIIVLLLGDTITPY
jgi:hypothetical protein